MIKVPFVHFFLGNDVCVSTFFFIFIFKLQHSEINVMETSETIINFQESNFEKPKQALIFVFLETIGIVLFFFLISECCR